MAVQSLSWEANGGSGTVGMSTTASKKAKTGLETGATVLAYGDMWTCCACGNTNLDATAPDRCPVCGHYRDSCCV